MHREFRLWAGVQVVLLILFGFIAQQNTAKADESENGGRSAASEAGEWKALLSEDTDSLDEHWRTTGNWILEDGVATLKPREGEKGWSRWSDYLWSKEEYGDFEIEFEYQLEERGNSGYYFRVGDVNDPVEQGIEVQIYATDPDKAQDKLTDHDSGGIIPGLKPHRNASKPAGEWNKMRVRHQGDKVVVVLNGVEVNSHDFASGGRLAGRPHTGPIGFQDHALPISLRNIRIRTPGELAGDTRSNAPSKDK